MQAELELTEEVFEEKDNDEGSISEPANVVNKKSTEKVVLTLSVVEVKPPPPFPQRLKKNNNDVQFNNFVDILDQLYINILLLKAIDHIPNYAKFLNEIVTKNRKVEKFETFSITKEFCSALNKLPPKQKDSRRFFIPCSIGENYVGKALCDLGSSVNLMSKSIYLNLEMGNARPTSVILQLADNSHVRLEGRIKDFIVRVDKFVFPTDFLILDYKVDANTPIILGRPFLATCRILIYCEKGMWNDYEEYQSILKMNSKMEEEDDQLFHNNFIQLYDYEKILEENKKEKAEEFPLEVQEFSLLLARPSMCFEPLDFDEFIHHKTSLQHAPKLELKTLPLHLKYAYLGDDETLHVIISYSLKPEQE
ncbi:uncharacterized protein LOC120122143 [Hibiscus syriacus]|uniref:uncharacterized protein LOC120122143 n=1 Tax=Hibiscus syriacus TaxID=106335 RepID=UPI0019226F09|nr:uncharacterized protein LOC120122143 [Hibiscus syriacus]